MKYLPGPHHLFQSNGNSRCLPFVPPLIFLHSRVWVSASQQIFNVIIQLWHTLTISALDLHHPVSSCSCCNMNIKCHSLINNLAQSLPERRVGFATETSEVISRTTISIFGNQNEFILVKSFLLHRTMSMTNSNVKVPLGPGFIFSYWQYDDSVHHEMVSRFVIIGSRDPVWSAGQHSINE